MRPNNLKFAIDKFIFVENYTLNLKIEAKKVGLEINSSKTKYMTIKNTDKKTLQLTRNIKGTNIYKYLGQS